MVRISLTGERLKLARETVGYDSCFALADAWRKYNKGREWEDDKGLPVVNKTIAEWELKGIPGRSKKRKLENCLDVVAHFFGVDKNLFTMTESEGWSEARFKEKILEAWNIRHNKKRKGVMTVLSDTIDAISPNTMEITYQQFRGYYFGYMNWTRWIEGIEKGSAYRFLVYIGPYEPEVNVIHAKLTTGNYVKYLSLSGEPDKWAYHGVMVPIPGKLHFILEKKKPSLYEMGLFYLFTQDYPKDHLLGILMADSSTPERAGHQRTKELPCSTRILLEKIHGNPNEGELIQQLRYLEPDELEDSVRKEIENEIDEKTGVLMTYSQPTK